MLITLQVNLYVALAPVAYVKNVGSVILQALAKYAFSLSLSLSPSLPPADGPYRLEVEEIFELLGVNEFNLPNAIKSILPGYCTLFPSYARRH
jgi:hypothetical protein